MSAAEVKRYIELNKIADLQGIVSVKYFAAVLWNPDLAGFSGRGANLPAQLCQKSDPVIVAGHGGCGRIWFRGRSLW